MPGRLFLTRDIGQPHPPRLNVAPGQDVWVRNSDGFVTMRWGLIPVGRTNARGRPVMETIINARSETLFDKSAFADVQRAAVPVDGWYEWTGKARRKQPWRIQRKDGAILWFAAIYDVWQGPSGISLPQVATVTCAPNADVAAIHHRMGVILSEENVEAWLCAPESEAKALLRPLPEGILDISAADDVDWLKDEGHA